MRHVASQVNMLAREYCDAAGIKLKPIILSHHMLYGLSKGQAKMSKSNKESAIFMEDSAEDVTRKINNAYCPLTPEEHEEKPGEESMSLVVDKLKNPCLDYVQHIIFCAPGSSFTAGGKTYTDFPSVREAFLSQKLSTDDLKAGIIAAVNKLLEPVRSHFQNDKEASRILKLITGWMAEPKAATASKLRRLVAPLSGSGPHFVVFAPLASAKPSLASALDTLRCLRRAPATHAKVLWLRDWSAFCHNCLGGGKTREDDLKAVAAADTLFVAGLRALAPELMAGVQVITQSEALLTNSSDYWISVINAGRAFPLSAVRSVDEGMSEAGHVITTLMHVADVLAVSATGTATCLCGTEETMALHKLAASYVSRPEAAAAGLTPPECVEARGVSLRLKSLADENAAMDPDNELLLLDGAPDVQRKMKKAFCEPQNLEHCPPIAVVEEAVLPYGATRKLQIKRPPDNGGDVEFVNGAAIRESFAAGGLHPGDLKPAARDAVNEVLQVVRAAISADPELKKAEKEVDKAAKRKKK